MTTYYVSQNGDNSDPTSGVLTEAQNTLQGLVTAINLDPGDIVIINDYDGAHGVYNETVVFDSTDIGGPGNPIIVQPRAGDTIEFDAVGLDLCMQLRSYITVKDINFKAGDTGVSKRWIYASGCVGTIIENSNFTANAGSNDGVNLRNGDNITMSNCTFDCGGVIGTAITAFATTGSLDTLTLEDIVITNCTGSPMSLGKTGFPITDVTLNNIFIDGGAFGIRLEYIVGCKGSGITINNTTAAGIEAIIPAENIVLSNISIDATSGPIVKFNGVTDISLTNVTGLNGDGGIYFFGALGPNSGIILNNINMDLASISGFYLDNVTDCVISNALIDGGNTALRITGESGVNHDIVVNNLRVVNGGSNGVTIDGPSSGGYDSYNIELNDCIIDGSLGDGYSTKWDDNVTGGTGQWNVYNVTYNRCIAKNCGTTSDVALASGDGFTAHGENYGIDLHYCLAHNNYNTGVGMVGNTQGKIYNCTFVNNGSDGSDPLTPGSRAEQLGFSTGQDFNARAGLWLGCAGAHPAEGAWEVKNTITQNNYPREILLTANVDSLVTMDYNQYHHIGVGITEATFASIAGGNVTQENYFIAMRAETPTQEVNSTYDILDLVGPIAEDFHLRTLSSCIGAGDFSIASAGDTDLDKKLIDSPIDLGAYKYFSETVISNNDPIKRFVDVEVIKRS